MLFSLRELVQWLGFATFELLLQAGALALFSLLLVLKLDGVAALSWWGVFGPFFAADGLSTYFTAIVSVRLFQDGEKRLAVLRLFWVLTLLSLKFFVFEMLLCQKLVEQTPELWYGLIMSPVFILLQLLMIRACRVN
nr:transmembrane protein 203 isoform X2 [Pelodiscus sinensis]|eukprot:XP_006131902.1 transmembrane protein 203 isoform X2 [Pelodiscus sinensis]